MIENIIYKKKLLALIVKGNYRKKKGIQINPKTWCKIKFKTNNSILMVFCDREYEYHDYIENYNQFLKIIKKKK